MAKAMIRKTEKARAIERLALVVTDYLKPGNMTTYESVKNGQKRYDLVYFVRFQQALSKKLDLVQDIETISLYNDVIPCKEICETIDEIFDCGWQNLPVTKKYNLIVDTKKKEINLFENNVFTRKFIFAKDPQAVA